jgi:hypothetical protein
MVFGALCAACRHAGLGKSGKIHAEQSDEALHSSPDFEISPVSALDPVKSQS